MGESGARRSLDTTGDATSGCPRPCTTGLTRDAPPGCRGGGRRVRAFGTGTGTPRGQVRSGGTHTPDVPLTSQPRGGAQRVVGRLWGEGGYRRPQGGERLSFGPAPSTVTG